MMVYRDYQSVSGIHFSFHPVQDEDTFALHDGPCFRPVAVHLVGNVLSGIDGDALGQGVPAICIGCIVDDPVGAPASLLIHRPRSEIVNGLLDVLGVFLPADDDPIRAGGDDRVFHPVNIDWILEFIDDVGVSASRAHHGVAYNRPAELICKGVPGAEVLPLPGVRHHGNGLRLLRHFIVEGNLRELAVSGSGILKGIRFDVFPHDVHHITEPECEHSAVPQGPYREQLLRTLNIRLLGELTNFHRALRIPAFCLRNHIAVLLARICRGDTHQY